MHGQNAALGLAPSRPSKSVAIWDPAPPTALESASSPVLGRSLSDTAAQCRSSRPPDLPFLEIIVNVSQEYYLRRQHASCKIYYYAANLQ